MPTYAFYLKNVREGSTDANAGQSLTLEWEGVCDDASVDPGDVIAAFTTTVGIGKGSPHPTYAYALCTRIDARGNDRDPFRWDLKAQFLEPKPQPGDEVDPDGGQPSPPDRAPQVRGEFRREDAVRNRDNDDRPFVNSAGDYFDNPPPIPLTIGSFTVTRFYESIDYFVLRSYENKCNSEEWEGFPPHSLCITGVPWEPYSERGWNGWKVVWTVEHREVTPEQESIVDLAPFGDLVGGVVTGGFYPTPVLDAGWYELPGGVLADKRPYEEPAGSGRPSTVPGLLDGETGERADANGPYYVGFDIYGRISFAALLE